MAKKKSKSTVNVDAIRRESKRLAKERVANQPASESHGDLDPGMVKRESTLEQEMGPSKYKDMIHSHNDKNKHILDRLPFTFPKKKKIRSHTNVLLECPNCQKPHWGSEHTYGIICSGCKKYVNVVNPVAIANGYHKDSQRSK